MQLSTSNTYRSTVVSFNGTFWNNLAELQSGLTDDFLENSVVEVNKPGFIMSGSLPASENIYIRLEPASLIKLLESSMSFSMSVFIVLYVCDGRVI